MKNSRIQGIVGTVTIHLIVLAVLLLVYMHQPQEQTEGGVPVMLGNTAEAGGDADPYTLTEVDVMPQESQPETAPIEPEPQQPTEQQMITQNQEKTVAIEPEKKSKPKTEKVKTETKRQPQPTVKPQKTAEQIAAEQREAAEKKAAAEVRSKIAGAFGKGTSMGSRGNSTGSGLQGSPTGNSNTGKTTGVGGVGSWDLNGRNLSGSLPVPLYNVQDEGRVVVTIIVSPQGKVISTSINKRTNTVSAALRRAAEEAARKARFNQVDGVNNQSGTITYYFKLR